MVHQGSRGYFSGVKVENVKLIADRREIQTMAFTQIMAILKSGRSLVDHLRDPTKGFREPGEWGPKQSGSREQDAKMSREQKKII